MAKKETVVETTQTASKTTDTQVTIDARIPQGPLAEKWKNYKAHQKLVNPSNKRRLDIIVVGTGLAGASAAAGSNLVPGLCP